MSDVGRTLWLAERRNGVGASDVAGILGLSPWSSPYSVWADKVFGLGDDRDTAAMSFGRRAEPMIAAWFHELTGLYVAGEQTRVHDVEHPWRFCTLDGKVYETPDNEDGEFLAAVGAFVEDDALGLLQIKTTSATPKEWEDGIPVMYQCQEQYEMAVTGAKRVYLAVLHLAFGRPDLKVYELARDQTDIDLIVKAVDTFWHDHVIPGVPPETDAHQATTYATKHLPASVGDMTEVSDEVKRTLLDIADLKESRKGIDELLDQLENRVRSALGDCTEGYHGGHLVVSHREQSKRYIDETAFRGSMPATAAKFTAETRYRVLRQHKPKKRKKQ